MPSPGPDKWQWPLVPAHTDGLKNFASANQGGHKPTIPLSLTTQTSCSQTWDPRLPTDSPGAPGHKPSGLKCLKTYLPAHPALESLPTDPAVLSSDFILPSLLYQSRSPLQHLPRSKPWLTVSGFVLHGCPQPSWLFTLPPPILLDPSFTGKVSPNTLLLHHTSCALPGCKSDKLCPCILHVFLKQKPSFLQWDSETQLSWWMRPLTFSQSLSLFRKLASLPPF